MNQLSNELFCLLKKSTLECKGDCIALSGGLDSSIISYFLKDRKINAIAIISKDFVATDLTYCQMIAKKFNFNLDIKSISTNELLVAIEETIKILKNFNDIEIRNSVVMYLAIKAAKEKGIKYIITGDGADELFAGYNFFLNKNKKDLQIELERIWKIMHFPAQKIGKALNIKIESPFLNEEILEFVRKIPSELLINEKNNKKFGKWILRKTFEDKIPKSIIWREKSPMQDGAGTSALTNLFETLIQDNVYENKVKDIKKSDNVILRSKESLYYYELYQKYFEPPYKMHGSSRKCPYCQYSIEPNSKFCRMCGSFPI